MTYRVVILARARHDIQEKYDWIAAESPEGAERWLNRFEQAMETLRTNPFVAPLAPESKSFDIEIRHILFRTRYGRPYRAIFTVVGDEVRILRVRGSGQPPLKSRDISMDG
jgi:plasmid stabilization system protein ParE